jgi:hypothetical protein
MGLVARILFGDAAVFKSVDGGTDCASAATIGIANAEAEPTPRHMAQPRRQHTTYSRHQSQRRRQPNFRATARKSSLYATGSNVRCHDQRQGAYMSLALAGCDVARIRDGNGDPDGLEQFAQSIAVRHDTGFRRGVGERIGERIDRRKRGDRGDVAALSRNHHRQHGVDAADGAFKIDAELANGSVEIFAVGIRPAAIEQSSVCDQEIDRTTAVEFGHPACQRAGFGDIGNAQDDLGTAQPALRRHILEGDAITRRQAEEAAGCGIGQSQLAAETAARASDDDALWRTMYCTSCYGSAPFLWFARRVTGGELHAFGPRAIASERGYRPSCSPKRQDPTSTQDIPPPGRPVLPMGPLRAVRDHVS